MPKISELPEGVTLTGEETMDLVQGGENVKVLLKTLLNAPREVSVSNARWIQSSLSTELLNTTALEIDNASLRTLTAKANILCNPSNIIRWNHEFEGVLESADFYFDLECDGITPPNPFHAGGGEFTLTLESGSAIIEVDGIQTAPGPFSVPYGQEKLVTVQSGTAAVVRITCTQRYNETGMEPETFAAGDQLTVSYNDQPRAGTFTARAQVLSSTGEVQATSNDVTLTLALQQAQGS